MLITCRIRLGSLNKHKTKADREDISVNNDRHACVHAKNVQSREKERGVKANDDSFSFPEHPLFRLQSTVRLKQQHQNTHGVYVNKTQIKNNDDNTICRHGKARQEKEAHPILMERQWNSG
jgi:hypothetical protein